MQEKKISAEIYHEQKKSPDLFDRFINRAEQENDSM